MGWMEGECSWKVKGVGRIGERLEIRRPVKVRGSDPVLNPWK